MKRVLSQRGALLVESLFTLACLAYLSFSILGLGLLAWGNRLEEYNLWTIARSTLNGEANPHPFSYRISGNKNTEIKISHKNKGMQLQH